MNKNFRLNICKLRFQPMVVFVLLLSSYTLVGQQTAPFQLTNAFIVAQLDRPEEKFSLEINLAELFSEQGVNVFPSLNILKQGQNPTVLASDSITSILKNKQLDTYVLVSVRGYDRNYRKKSKQTSLVEELSSSHLFPIYRDDIVSLTFEFLFYQNGTQVYSDLLKIKNINNKDSVLKKLHKKLPKLIHKWKNGVR
ncbi:MAG: hypothetical protein ACKO7P_11205 [Bacteroidota bacterium]